MSDALPRPGAPEPEAILTRAEVAAWLKIEPRQVDRLGVPVLNLGRKTKRYLRSDVLAWLRSFRGGHLAPRDAA